MKVLCIIPLRKGSKRLPNKNFLPLCGKTLHRWVAGEAERTKMVDKIVISTDMEKRFLEPGDHDYIKRPAELATDDASTEDVITDVITRSEYKSYNTILVLQATSPLTCMEDIENAIKTFVNYGLSSLVSVNENYYPNGAIYITTRDMFLKSRSFWTEGMGILKMDNRRSLDINDVWDFRVAESLLKGLVFPQEDPHPRQREAEPE